MVYAFRFPTVGFWSDNEGEFQNMKMEEFFYKLGLKIDFTPSHYPWWSDRIVKKVMEQDKKLVHQDALKMAANDTQYQCEYNPWSKEPSIDDIIDSLNSNKKGNK